MNMRPPPGWQRASHSTHPHSAPCSPRQIRCRGPAPARLGLTHPTGLEWRRKTRLPRNAGKVTTVPDWLLAIANTDIGNAEVFLYTPRETIYNRPQLMAPEP